MTRAYSNKYCFKVLLQSTSSTYFFNVLLQGNILQSTAHWKYFSLKVLLVHSKYFFKVLLQSTARLLKVLLVYSKYCCVEVAMSLIDISLHTQNGYLIHTHRKKFIFLKVLKGSYLILIGIIDYEGDCLSLIWRWSGIIRVCVLII